MYRDPDAASAEVQQLSMPTCFLSMETFELGYQDAITIEREISGPRQMEDFKNAKAYLENVLAKVAGNGIQRGKLHDK